MSRVFKGFALLTVALLLAATVVACGGDDDDDDDSGGGGGGDTQATQQASPTADSGDDDDDNDDGGGGGGSSPLGNIESGSGTYTIDGEQYDAQIVVRCEPFDAGAFGGQPASEDDFDFTATDNAGTWVQGEVSFEEITSFSDPDKSYTAIHFRADASRQGEGGIEQYENTAVTAPDGSWYASEDLFPQFVIEGQPPEGDPLPAPNGLEIDGNHIVGALTLAQSWPDGATGTVDITFDLEIPGEAIDCSLSN